jgi:hypothetical protein
MQLSPGTKKLFLLNYLKKDLGQEVLEPAAFYTTGVRTGARLSA